MNPPIPTSPTTHSEAIDQPVITDAQIEAQTRLSLFELANLETPEEARLRLLEDSTAQISQLTATISAQTNLDLEARLNDLGGQSNNADTLTAEFNAEYESVIELLLNSKSNPQRFNLAYRQLQTIINGHLARIEVQVHNEAHIAVLSDAIQNNPIILAIISKLPTEQQEQIQTAINTQSNELSDLITRYLQPLGYSATTISIIATTSQNQPEGTIERIVSLIENLPGGQAISTVLTNLRASHLSGFYDMAETELRISDPRIFLDTMHQTLGELETIYTQIKNSRLNPNNPNDAILIDYVKLGDHILNPNFKQRLLQSFEAQFRATSELPIDQQNHIISRIDVNTLTVPVALAFSFGDQEMQYNWLTRLGGVFAYSRNIAMHAFSNSQRYQARRRRISTRLAGLTDSISGERHMTQTDLNRTISTNSSYSHTVMQLNSQGGPLTTFESSITQLESDTRNLNDTTRQQLNTQFDDTVRRINSDILNITPEDLNFFRSNFPVVRNADGTTLNLASLTDDELKTKINDQAFRDSIKTRHLNGVNEASLFYRHTDLADDFNSTVRQWQTQNRAEGQRLINVSTEFDGIIARVTASPTSITQTDIDYFRNIGSVTDSAGNLIDLRSLPEADLRTHIANTDFHTSVQQRLISDIEAHSTNTRNINSKLNGISQRLNQSGQQINARYRTRINPADQSIHGVQSDVSSLTLRGRAMRGATIAAGAGLVAGPSIYDVVQGRSDIEPAAIQVAQNAIYFVPVLGSIASITELVRGQTLSGQQLEGKDWWAAAGFTALGIGSDFLTLVGGVGVATRAALVSGRVAATAARGARTARAIGVVADLATTEGRTLLVARNGMRVVDSSTAASTAIRASGTSLSQAGDLYRTQSTVVNARRTQLLNQAASNSNSISRALLNFGARITPITTRIEIAGNIAGNIIRSAQNLGSGIYHYAGFLYHKVGQQLFRIAQVDPAHLADVTRIIRAENLDEAARALSLSSMASDARLAATTTIAAAEQGTTLRRLAEGASNITGSRTARLVARTEQLALVGTLGAVATSIISQGEIDPIEVVQTGFDAVGTTVSTTADGLNTGTDWLLESDHYRTSYEDMVGIYSQQYTDQQAFLESIGDPTQNIDALLDNWHNPNIRDLAAAYGMDINQLTDAYNQRIAAETALAEHTVEETSASAIS